jgi:anti-sigma regulatory factor (Ser/Thr protein kinase)
MSHLKLSPESVISTNFCDLVHEDAETGSVNRKLVQEKLVELVKTRKPVSFKVIFKTAIAAEFKEMQVRLEYINIEGMNEILGKATGLEEDALIAFFEKERQKYSISNYLNAADEVTQRITKNLAKRLNKKQITLVRIALREIIINAIEHGNLNISYHEKTDAIMSDNYFEFIAERRVDPRYKDRRVRIEHQIDSEKAVYKITDEGLGFEYRQVIDNDSREANELLLPHGRGISMAKNIFDQITYNKRGNEVLLVKNFIESA